MKAYVRYGAVAFLCVVGCTRPDSDLFGADGSPLPRQSGGSAGTSSSSGSSSVDTNSGANTNADMMTGGGTTTTDPLPVAGTSSTAGSAPQDQGGSGGSTNPPDPSGMAGMPDGAAGSPTPPADPVCGNGILEAGEQCDDAGHTGLDGCDADCQVVCSQHGQGTLESADHHCYHGYDQFDFTSAQQDCLKRGAHLATISSADENQIARTLTNNSKWIGGYENVGAMQPGVGDYEWLTGELFTYTNWAEQEPNHLEAHCVNNFNAHCYEHCIVILGDGTWADRLCDTPDGYVCEWDPAGTK
jgi:cysteine-rich repeat protein